MERVLFEISNTPITLAEALLGAVGLVFVGVCALIIILLKGNGAKVAEAAEVARSQLRDQFEQQVGERDGRIKSLARELDIHRESNTKLQAESARLSAMMQERDKQNAENLKRFEETKTRMTDEFKLIASDVLKNHGETFSKQNREQVDTLLKPLRDKVTEFQREAVEGRTQLTENLKRLAEDSINMRSEAQNLTRALKGNAQTQGAWGEMILSSVLERSGLLEGEHFEMQQSYSGEEGRVRTDVEIILPDNKGKMVVDSKVSLTAFEAYTNCEDADLAASYLKDHIQSLRTHVKTLGSKEYHRRAESEFDFVIMFVPIEGAFSLALRSDPALIDYAFSQNVSISTPTTLLSALRTISNIWDVDKRNKNAEQIAERAGKLYDKFAGFLSTMDKVGKSLDAAQSSFADAKGQLSEGAGNVVRQVGMLQELGAKTQKQIPQDWEKESNESSLEPVDSLPKLPLPNPVPDAEDRH